MRFILKFGLFLTIILVITSILLPPSYGLTFPRNPGPVTDQQVRTNHLQYLEEHQPQIVLMGDSTLALGLDPKALSEQTGKSVYNIAIPGSASALWYLILKNNIAESSHKPEYVLIIFRDSILTTPGYRVHGSYFELVDEYARRNEPLFIQNSFVNLMNPLEIAAEKYLPLYVTRTHVRNQIDSGIRYLLPPFFGCDENCVDFSLGEIFAGADLEPKALVDAVGAAESYLYTPERLNFASQVDKSYLPEMIRIAQESSIKLVFVRIKVETADSSKDPTLSGYLEALKTYIHEQGAYLLDYGDDPRLTHDLFRDVVHLNEEGKALFTQMVAEGMQNLFGE
jgi:hypothetical protein